MDNKTYTIGILSLTALVLFIANCFAPQAAVGQVSIKDRDYSVATARVQSGGDGLYIVDNATGLMAVFVYDPSSRSVEARAVRNVADAFQQAGR